MGRQKSGRGKPRSRKTPNLGHVRLLRAIRGYKRGLQ